MPGQRDGPSQTVLDLVAEAAKLEHRLEEVLQDLRERDEPVAQTITKDIQSKINSIGAGSAFGSARAGQDAPPIKNGPRRQMDMLPGIVREGIGSYFQPNHISKQESDHRNLRAKLVEDVILAFLYANPGESRQIAYHDISEELNRLRLPEDRNTTYGRISRLRKEGLIAEIDPENRNAYFLTDEGAAYVQKMLAKRFAGGRA